MLSYSTRAIRLKLLYKKVEVQLHFYESNYLFSLIFHKCLKIKHYISGQMDCFTFEWDEISSCLFENSFGFCTILQQAQIIYVFLPRRMSQIQETLHNLVNILSIFDLHVSVENRRFLSRGFQISDFQSLPQFWIVIKIKNLNFPEET